MLQAQQPAADSPDIIQLTTPSHWRHLYGGQPSLREQGGVAAVSRDADAAPALQPHGKCRSMQQSSTLLMPISAVQALHHTVSQAGSQRAAARQQDCTPTHVPHFAAVLEGMCCAQQLTGDA